MSWDQQQEDWRQQYAAQQEDWRQQYAARGLPVPPQPAKAPYQPRPADQVARAFAGQLVGTAIPAPAFRFARPLFRPIANFFAPRRVGVHHSVAGTNFSATTPVQIPNWKDKFVRPSQAPYGKAGVTSSDQIPGMSYYWDASGRRGAAAAAGEGITQPFKILRDQMFGDDAFGRALVVAGPRFGTKPDVNPLVQGGVARMVPGQNQLRVVNEISGTPGVRGILTPGTKISEPGAIPWERHGELTAMIQRQKAIEAARSAGKLGAAGGAIYGANNVDMQALRELLR